MNTMAGHNPAGIHAATAIIPPLDEPHQQIRLLRIEAADFGDMINCTISIHSLSQAPDFIAISYVWGPEEPQRTIMINGKQFKVRDNCHYALQQARQCNSSFLPIWIDSICIDQSSTSEKGAQVRMMFDIYSQATRVFACVGQRDEASDIIEATLDALEDHLKESVEDLGLYDLRRFWDASDAERCAKMSEGSSFFEREYFQRVWIAQELLAGRGRTVYLCGQSLLNWSQLVSFDTMLETARQGEPSSFGRIHVWAYNERKASATLTFALDFLSTLRCSDPRDRVYGMLSKIRGRNNSLPSIIPDYSLPPLDLAVALIRGGYISDLFGLHQLVEALGLAHEENHMAKLSAMEEPDTDPEVREWISGVSLAAVIQSLPDGRLYLEGLSDTVSTDILDDDSPDTERPRVWSSGGISILGCPGTMPGDVLLRISIFLIIVRPLDRLHQYKVIGEAICIARYQRDPAVDCICKPEPTRLPVPRVFIRYQAGITDTLAWMIRQSITATSPAISPTEHEQELLLPRPELSTPAPGSILHDVTIEVHKKFFGADLEVREPRLGCPAHSQKPSVYRKALKRGPLWYGVFLGKGYGGFVAV